MIARTARRLATAALLFAAAGSVEAQTVDHAAFDRLLRVHVRDGLVDYDAFKADPGFAGYLKVLAATRLLLEP